MNLNKLLLLAFFPCLTTACLVFIPKPASAQAQSIKLELAQGETIKATLEKVVNKSVTLVLNSEKELSGKVLKVTDGLVHLSEISGKEYYDAVIKIDTIQAIIVKAK